ncbi:MAG: CFI-box-CTERM domain-containing protein [Planctomycetota bacterium]
MKQNNQIKYISITMAVLLILLIGTTSLFAQESITVDAPNGDETYVVTTTQTISWTWTGTIDFVTLYYSSDDFATVTNTIVSTFGNTGSYNWTIPDDISPDFRFKVKVADASNPAVYGVSDNGFRIRGWFDVTKPTIGDVYIVGRQQEIRWTTFGTMPTVKLEYSKDNFQTDILTISSAVSNYVGANLFMWTVPNDITPDDRVKVRVSLPTAPDINDDSVGFKIKADIIVTKPIGGERWITNEYQTINWVITGTVPSVNIYYSIDAATDTFNNPILVISDTPNTGSYYWKIPDEWGSPPITGVKTRTKVMVCDSRDLTSYGRSPNTFRIDYYYITFEVKDKITLQHMRALTFMDPSRGWSEYPVSSPKTWAYPYGTYRTIVSKTGYLEEAVEEWVADRDKTFTLYMESSVIHNWQVMVDFNYNPINDSLFTTSWFMRDGIIMYDPLPDSLRIDIYDQAGNFVKSLQSSSPDIEGVFRIPWENTGLQSNTTYWAKAELTYSGVPFRSALTFKINEVAGTFTFHSWEVKGYINYNPSTNKLEVTSWLVYDGLIIPTPNSVNIEIRNFSDTMTKTLTASQHDSWGVFRVNWDNPAIDNQQTYTAYITILNGSTPYQGVIAFSIEKEESQAGSSGSGEGKKFLPCFIATAAYGSPLAKPVILLRQFRDRYLITSGIGQRALSVYYQYSPQLAGYISKHPVVKTTTQIILLPVIIYACLMVTTGLVVKILTSGLIILLGIILLQRSSPALAGLASQPVRKFSGRGEGLI